MSNSLHVELNDETMAALEAWAHDKGNGLSWSQAAALILKDALAGESRNGPVISKSERLIMGMLADVHAAVVEGRGQYGPDPEMLMGAIYGGHYWALDWELSGLMHDHVDHNEQVKSVVDTLDMWMFIEDAIKSLTPAQRDDLKARVPHAPTHFTGYDGNHETTYMSIARHLVERMGRFEFQKGRAYNSHSARVGKYAQMYKVFEPMRTTLGGRELTVDELVEVLSA